jgi:hypothetical protein
MKAYFVLSHEEARRRAIESVKLAPAGCVVTIKPCSRSLDQNAKLHALLSEIAKSVEWGGKKHDPEVWKRLLTAAWLRARGEEIECLPALDGQGVDFVFKRTSRLTKSEASELIEFIYAWQSENGG